MTSHRIRRLLRPALAVTAAFLLAACAKDAPQDALSPDGPIARQLDGLFKPVFWIATFVFFFVEGLIVFAAIKFRDRPGRDEPKQIHGNTRLELTWTIIPALLLAGISVPMVITLFDVQAKAQPNEIRVRVTGKQWWWEYEYLNLGDPHVVTANELVIPVNRPVFLELESADVIHSFWVPKLAGKQDVVPERTNTLQLIADRPDAVYEGQCAEFCALGHANMRLRVFTKTEAGFDRWVAEQRRDALEPTTQDAIAGKRLFFDGQCVSCHAIRGTEALARLGPDLTHFASRTSFAGSSLRLTGDPTADRELLFAWVKNTRKLKPGVVMPVFEGVIPDDQINLIVAYLLSLK